MAFACVVLAVSGCERALPGDGIVGGPQADLDVGVPGNVYEVRTLGSWRDGSQAGVFRVVMLRGGLDHVRTSLIIQWMAQGIGDEAPHIVATRWVELLDDLGPIAVLAMRELTSSDGLHLSIRVKNLASGEEGDVDAIARTPGQLTSTFVAVDA